MEAKVKRILDVLEKVLMIVGGILTVIMTLSICDQVFLRYIFHRANSWAEEVARYSMMWIAMLLSPVGFRRHRHIRVDFIVNMMPKKVQHLLAIIINCFMIFFLVMLGRAGWTMADNCFTQGQLTPALKFNMGFMYITVTICAVMSILYILECIWDEGVKPLLQSRESVEKEENK